MCSLHNFFFLPFRGSQPSFDFENEKGYGPGVDREAWEMIAGDLVLPYPPPPPPQQQQQSTTAAATTGGAQAGDTAGAAPATSAPAATKGDDMDSEPFFVPVDGGMSSYCPRDLRGEGWKAGAAGGGGSAATMRGQLEMEKDLQDFELLGIVIGANLGWNKVRERRKGARGEGKCSVGSLTTPSFGICHSNVDDMKILLPLLFLRSEQRKQPTCVGTILRSVNIEGCGRWTWYCRAYIQSLFPSLF